MIQDHCRKSKNENTTNARIRPTDAKTAIGGIEKCRSLNAGAHSQRKARRRREEGKENKPLKSA
jgi:hypothetical protein